MPQLAISNLPTGIISDLLEQINDSLKTIAERSHDHQAKLVELANDIAEMKTRLQQRDERHNFPLANHSLRWATAPLKTATRTSPVNSTGMEHEGNGLVKAPDDQVYERAPDTHAYQVSPSRWITDPSTIEQLNATARVDFYAFSKFGPRLQSRLEGTHDPPTFAVLMTYTSQDKSRNTSPLPTYQTSVSRLPRLDVMARDISCRRSFYSRVVIKGLYATAFSSGVMR